MLDQIVEQIIQLKTVIICSAVATLFVTAISLVFCHVFSWRGKNLKLIGFFYNMNIWETIALATCIMKLFVVISLIFGGGHIQMVQIIAYGVLVVAYNICRAEIKEVLPSIVNGGIIMGVLVVVNMLSNYLVEVLFDLKIAIALGILGVFLFLFALYDIASCVLHLIEHKR